MPQPKRPHRILVVDDDLAIRELLTEYLATRGYDVVPVSDGRSASRHIEDGGYDLVVADLRIPHPDGLALLQAARDRGDWVPFIMMTGYGTVESAVYALKLGAVDYLLKPFKLRAIQAAIEQALARSRTDAEHREGRAHLALLDDTASIASEQALERWMERFLPHAVAMAQAQAIAVFLATGDPPQWTLRWVYHAPGLERLLLGLDTTTLAARIEEGSALPTGPVTELGLAIGTTVGGAALRGVVALAWETPTTAQAVPLQRITLALQAALGCRSWNGCR